MEVRVDTYLEEKDGTRRAINRAYLSLVGLDDNGCPKQIPYGIRIETESQKGDYEGALKRMELRRIRQTEGF